MPKANARPFEIVLVHGTLPPWRWFARVKSEADVQRLFPWTDPAAKKSLASRLAAIEREGHEVSLVRLPWPGRNSVAARDEGASRLADILAADPQRPRALVAHSHGGNVAIRALQRTGSPKSVLGTVCIATPFLQLLPRDPNGILWLRSLGLLSVLLSGLLLFLMLLGMGLAGVVGAFQHLSGGPGEGTSPLLSGILIAASALGLLTLVWARKKLGLRSDDEAEEDLLARQEQVLGDHRTPVETPCLAIQAAGDEAGAWLKGVSLLSGLAAVLRHRVVASLAVVALVVAAFATFGLAWEPSETDDASDIVMMAALSLAVWLAAAAAAYFVFTSLVLLLALAFEALPVAFGSRRQGWHLTRTAVSLAPLYGRHNEFRVYSGRSLLLHSIYSSSEVQDDIVEWIEKLPARSAGST